MLRLAEIKLTDSLDLGRQLIEESITASFFQQPEWLCIWNKHFGDQKELILGIYEKEKLIGIAPLTRHDNKITFLGTDPVLHKELVSDFGDIIAKNERETEVWETVLKNFQFSIFNFQFIREDSPSFKMLQNLGGKIEAVDVAPFVDLPNSWEEYLASLNRHNRHELRRKIRKLEAEKAFRVCYEGEPADIDEFFRLMALSNEQKRDFLSAKMRQFFSNIFTTFWPKKMLQLCFLKLNGVNIAAVVVFLYKDEFLLYNSGFDPDYAYLSPGLLLKAFLIKKAIEEGKKRFDFLRGGERYKYELGGKERKLYRITL